jgi:exodeoxyribonuclease VII small subunit
MADKAKDKDPKPTFEKDLESLEAIVTQLEEGGLPLDESITRFEDGIKLWKRCEQALSHAEKRIEILTKGPDGELEAAPFDDDSGDKPAKTAKKIKPAPKAGPVDVPDDETGGTDEADDEDDELLF